MTTLDRPLSERTRFVTLASDVMSGAGELMRAHGEQIRAEVRQQTTKCSTASVMLAVGAFLTMLGVIALMVTLALGLMSAFGWSPVAAWGATAALFLLIGGGFAFAGYTTIRTVRLVPAESLQSMKESLQWMMQK